jgi:hypothetical protein
VLALYLKMQMYFSCVCLYFLAQMALRAVQKYCLPTSRVILIQLLLKKIDESLWGSGGIALRFLPLALDGAEWSAELPCCLTNSTAKHGSVCNYFMEDGLNL